MRGFDASFGSGRRLKQLEKVPSEGLLHHPDMGAFSIILGDDIAPFPKIIQVLPLGLKNCLKAELSSTVQGSMPTIDEFLGVFTS